MKVTFAPPGVTGAEMRVPLRCRALYQRLRCGSTTRRSPDSYRSLTAESVVQPHSNPYGIYGEESGTGTSFPPWTQVLPAPGTDSV